MAFKVSDSCRRCPGVKQQAGLSLCQACQSIANCTTTDSRQLNEKLPHLLPSLYRQSETTIQHTSNNNSISQPAIMSISSRRYYASRACPNRTRPNHLHILLRGASSSRPTRRAPHPGGGRDAPCCLQPCSNLQLCSFAGISETSPRPWPSTWQYTRASMTREAKSRRAVRPRTTQKA